MARPLVRDHAPLRHRRRLPNFPEDGLDPWAAEYLGANRERLLELKRRYDPEGVFG